LSEARITGYCKTLFQRTSLKHSDFYYQKISDKFTSGLPDYYLLYRGVSIWIELKDKNKKPDPIQVYTMRCLKRAGAIVIWTDNFDVIENFIDQLLTGKITAQPMPAIQA